MFFFHRNISYLFLFLLISTSTYAQESILLRNQYKEGQEVFFDVTLGQEGITRVEGSERETKNKTYVLFGFKTDTITESGKANLSMKIHEMDMENPLTTTGTKPDLKKTLGLSDSVMRMTIDERGTIIHAPSVGDKAPSGGQNQLTEQIPWLNCPENEVTVGDSWSFKRMVPMTGASKPIIAYTTFTLDSVEEVNGEQIAVIHTVTDIDEKDVVVDPFQNQPAGANLIFKFTFVNYTLHTTGTIRFNQSKGHILSKEETGTMVQERVHDLNMDNAAFPANIVSAFTISTDAKFLETKPE